MPNILLTLTPCTANEEQPLTGTTWILETAHYSFEYVTLSHIASDRESYKFWVNPWKKGSEMGTGCSAAWTLWPIRLKVSVVSRAATHSFLRALMGEWQWKPLRFDTKVLLSSADNYFLYETQLLAFLWLLQPPNACDSTAKKANTLLVGMIHPDY